MPLSEHEQRMLDEIESALYAEDPKFVSAVAKQSSVRHGGVRHKVQAGLVILVGLVLLVAGLFLPGIGDFKIVSLIGFLVMFGGALLLIFGGSKTPGPKSATAGSTGRASGKSSGKRKFSSRMQDRYNQRFDQGR